MTYWKYTCLTSTSKEIMGHYAGSKEEVLQFMEDNNLILINIEMDYLSGIKMFLKHKKIKKKNLPEFFKEFKEFLETDISIEESADILAKTTNDTALIHALDVIKEQTKKGFGVAESFEKTKLFTRSVIASIQAGESAGRLPESFDFLSNHYKKELELKSKILSKAWHPILTLIALAGSVLFISLVTFPQMEPLLAATQKPGSSNLFLSLLSFVQRNWIIGVMVVAALLVSCTYLKTKNPNFFAERIYSTHLVGDLLKASAFSKTFLNLATLQSSGIALQESLNLLYKADRSYINTKLHDQHQYLIGGSSFWEALQKDDFFPAYIWHTVRKGENTGKHSEYYLKISNYYTNQVKSVLDKLVDTINPLLFVFCFVMVLLVISTFILPIYTDLPALMQGSFGI